MIKIACVKYPNVLDVDLRRKREPVIFTTCEQQIKPSINHLLFTEKFNYLLINLKNKLYIVEPIDREKKSYSNRSVEYHPYKKFVE